MDAATNQEISTLNEALLRVAELEKQLKESKESGRFIGVTNTYDGDCWVRPVGGNEDGRDDIKIPGKQARPITAITWEYMLKTDNSSVKSGQLVRDDSVLGDFGYKSADIDFNERKRFPNMVTDLDIEGWYKLTSVKFEQRLSEIDSPYVIERILNFGLEMSKPKNSHIQIAKDRFFKVAYPLPSNFDKETSMSEVAKTANMLNISLKRENFDIKTGTVDELKQIIKQELDMRKKDITI